MVIIGFELFVVFFDGGNRQRGKRVGDGIDEDGKDWKDNILCIPVPKKSKQIICSQEIQT